MTYQSFVRDPAARRRYWARSHAGWRRIATAVRRRPHAVARLYRLGLVTGVITQNVDGLHQVAGAGAVTELHGSLSRVVCLTCADTISRRQFDERLSQANPYFDAQVTRVNPDGDVDLPDEPLDGFHVVDCQVCTAGSSSRMWCSSVRRTPAPRVRNLLRSRGERPLLRYWAPR